MPAARPRPEFTLCLSVRRFNESADFRENAVQAPVIFAVPADVDLAPDPIRPHWIIEGTPQARSKRLAESADGTSMIIAWACSPGRFNWHYAVDETLHIISGEVFMTDEKGEVRRAGPGDMVFFPAGSRSTWHVTKEVKKLAVCRHSMPRPFGTMLRAWNMVADLLTGFSAGRGMVAECLAAPVEGARAASG
jgi:uncharacterized protein